jgi:hypothetical protein
MNALIGAAVTVVLVFIPFSSILGGAVAGYLQGGDLRDGLTVGAIAGVFAAVPMVVFVVGVGSLVSLGLMGLGAHRPLAIGVAILAFVLVFSLLYLIGLSMVGGAFGAAVSRDTDLVPSADA